MQIVASKNQTNLDKQIEMGPQDEDHLHCSRLWPFPLLWTLTKPFHASKNLPEDNLGIDFSQRTRLPLSLDLCVVPVAALLRVIWVVVDHHDHSRLQLVPLVHRTGPRANILGQQLYHPILWVTGRVNVESDCSLETSHTHHHRCFLLSAAREWSWMYTSMKRHKYKNKAKCFNCQGCTLMKSYILVQFSLWIWNRAVMIHHNSSFYVTLQQEVIVLQ